MADFPEYLSWDIFITFGEINMRLENLRFSYTNIPNIQIMVFVVDHIFCNDETKQMVYDKFHSNSAPIWQREIMDFGDHRIILPKRLVEDHLYHMEAQFLAGKNLWRVNRGT